MSLKKRSNASRDSQTSTTHQPLTVGPPAWEIKPEGGRFPGYALLYLLNPARQVGYRERGGLRAVAGEGCAKWGAWREPGGWQERRVDVS